MPFLLRIEAPGRFGYSHAMNLAESIQSTPGRGRLGFLQALGWDGASSEPLTGDASARKYFRLRKGEQTAVLMDASQNPESVPPFLNLDHHLEQLGFSVPQVLAWDGALVLLEDFGDGTFARLLDEGSPQRHSDPADRLYGLATDVLVALHQHPKAIPNGLREYSPEKMLEDLELFLEWRTPTLAEPIRAAFREAWRTVLPRAHQVPRSLLLRDYHAANLMLLPGREGVRQAGLLDFQDAYQGPVTYDLVSLLEDARREVPESLREKMLARYEAGCSGGAERGAFLSSLAILAALRHTRVLGIFERLSRRDGKPEYRRQHSPRVEGLLWRALNHPALAEVRGWMEKYGR